MQWEDNGQGRFRKNLSGALEYESYVPAPLFCYHAQQGRRPPSKGTIKTTLGRCVFIHSGLEAPRRHLGASSLESNKDASP